MEVTIEEDTEPRRVAIPADFLKALGANPPAQRNFAALSYSHQREYVRWIEEAKRKETRRARTRGPRRCWRRGRSRASTFSPKFDPLLAGYKDKTGSIEEEELPRVSRPAGQVEAIILLQGRAAATWRASLAAGGLRMTINPFRPLNRSEQARINDAAERLAGFLAAKGREVFVQSWCEFNPAFEVWRLEDHTPTVVQHFPGRPTCT